MDLCALCRKEDPILGATATAYPIGERCYGMLVEFGVSWDQDTTLSQLKAELRERKRARRDGAQI